ncbi:hypothetical protein SAMN06272765_2530 [Streptomyces sp. Ag109_G2-15]|nr:hypothetical protein SAMN06272765_2530 [Streptomyces sp. Ag109_G2-15]
MCDTALAYESGKIRVWDGTAADAPLRIPATRPDVTVLDERHPCT